MADASVLAKYTVLPKSCLDLWVESVGVGRLADDVGEVLAEDVTYRIRESVHNALRIMRHCKRSYLTTEDFNNGLNQCNTELIYGHEGMDSLSFNSVSFKEGRVCYVEEKEINLREMALEPVYPADPGEMSVKASWLVLEGHLCSLGKTKEDHKAPLKEPVSSYLTNITSALIGKSSHLRKIALKDLMVNKKLQVVLPHLVSFFSSQFKHHTGKESFSLLASYVLLAINALVENQSILLAPYVFQLVKIMLYVVTEAKIPVSKWHIKEKAAYVLAHLCRKENLTNQLIKSYQDSLADNSRPLGYLYGAIMGIKILGVDVVERVLYPSMKEKLQIFSEKCTVAESCEEILELAALRSALSNAVSSFLLKSPSSDVLKENIGYKELFEELGEGFLHCCMRTNHQLTSNSKLGLFTKGNTLNISRSDSLISQLIKKSHAKVVDTPIKLRSENIISKIIIDGNISLFTSKRNFHKRAMVFNQEEEEEAKKMEGVPHKKMKLHSHERKKMIQTHPSYHRKQRLAGDLRRISSFVPIM